MVTKLKDGDCVRMIDKFGSEVLYGIIRERWLYDGGTAICTKQGDRNVNYALEHLAYFNVEKISREEYNAFLAIT